MTTPRQWPNGDVTFKRADNPTQYEGYTEVAPCRWKPALEPCKHRSFSCSKAKCGRYTAIYVCAKKMCSTNPAICSNCKEAEQ